MDLDAWHLQYDALYGHHLRSSSFPGALLGISTPGNWAGFKIPLEDTDAIDRKLVQLDRQKKDIYFRVVPLQPGRYAANERAGADRNMSIPALWGDGDSQDGVHKPFNKGGQFAGFPHPTRAELLDMLEGLDTPPTMIVASGGGLHFYNVMAEPLENAPIKTHPTYDLLARWDYAVNTSAKSAGFGIDTGISSDVARILRVAGSRNFKRGTDNPTRVEVIAHHPNRLYTRRDLEECLPFIPKAPTRTRTVATAPQTGDRRKGNAWAARVPVSALMEEVWDMTTNDGEEGGRRWVFPREDGTASASDKHAKTFVSDRGVEYVVAYGTRVQEAWGVSDFRTALTSWDLLQVIVGGNLPLARFIAKEFPAPTTELFENLRAAEANRHALPAAA